MSSNLDFSPEALLDLSSFDPRDPRYPFAANTMVRAAWPMPLDMSAQPPNERQSTSPSAENARQYSQTAHPNPSPTLLTNWPMQQPQNQQQQQHQQQQQQQPQQLPHYLPENALMGPQYTFGNNFQTSPLDYHMPTTQAAFEAGLQMEAPFNGLAQSVEQAAMWANWQEIENAMMIAGANDGLPRAGRQSLGSNSPTGTYLEVLSLPSSGSDNGWSTVDHYNSMESYQAQNAAIFNPGQTLHLRTHSDSSQSDGTGHTIESFGSFEDISNPYSPYSPGSDTYLDLGHRNCFHGEHTHPHENISPAAAVAPVPIKISSSTRTSPAVTSSPPSARRNSAPRKSPTTKATKPVIRRTSNGKKDTEKRVGRRRGPLLPEQRKQASEIRKLRACLRCKFLKKTCDKGEPCAGCQPSHARLWQVPCTRIDIKDIGYFMKDWRADYERHVGRGVTVYNIKGFAQKEELLWITHGYGFALPLMSREVYVTDDSCFSVDWVEATEGTDENYEFDYRTAKISAGAEGVPTEVLSEYLDKHLDGPFEDFVDDHFEGTPFITDIFKTAHRYYVKEKVQVVRKALKLVLAYNLTQHITMVEQRGDEHPMEGLIDDEDCRFAGKIVAPVMINFQIKCALADMWRELQKEILEELSSLYSSVYSGDRLKNWPTIFMIASILLAVWEEMQFDCHYRVPDAAAVNKFCTDMETTPVGVIVGLFHAISQKLPAFTEWETRRHGQLLNNNVAVCEAMTEMRQHVTKHESYLKTRPEAKFDRSDFDCLSNKFLSKLVIRAN